MRILELYCGIGGCAAAALGEAAERELSIGIAGAIDQSPRAIDVHRLNFSCPGARDLNLEDATAEMLASFRADLWWLSPPCQPYTRKGLQRDLADPRALSFRRILGHLGEIRPRHLALENVEGFARSEARRLLLTTLDRAGYSVAERFLCPTELGIPMRRPRYYIVASLDRLAPETSGWSLEPRPDLRGPWARPLRDYLDPEDRLPPEILLPDDQVKRFGPGLRVLDPADPMAYTTCFASGYGRQLMRSGAYLGGSGGRVRYFTPREIVRLMHFPEEFRFPPEIPMVKQWQLAGNSLSVAAVRDVLRGLAPFRR